MMKKSKKLLSLLLALFMILTAVAVMPPAAAAADETPEVETAVVTVTGLNGESQSMTFQVGDTFTVYTMLNTSAIDEGRISSVHATQSYNSEVLALADAYDEEEGEILDLNTMFPITKGDTVANGKLSGEINFNASIASIVSPFFFDSNAAKLIVTHYTVIAPGTSDITTAFITLAGSDRQLTKIVDRGVIVNPNFTLYASFTDPEAEPTEAPTEEPTEAPTEAPTAPPVQALAITAQPVDWTGAKGETATFTVVAEGTDLSYRWFYRPAGKTNWIDTGVTESVYAIPMSDARNGRQLYCQVTDGAGNSLASDTVTMSYPVVSGPVITSQPADWTGNDGDSITISVTAEGEGLTYRWFYWKEEKSKWIAAADTDASYDALTMNAKLDGRRVYCRITDINGNSVDSDEATISYAGGPVITQQPCDWYGGDGELILIDVCAEGEGLTYQWFYWKEEKSKWIAAADTDNEYDVLTMNPKLDGRRVFCRITDANGISVDSDEATISYAGGPVITAQPADWTGNDGEQITISVVAEGDSELTYQWFYWKEEKSKWIAAADTDASYDELTMAPKYNGRQVYCRISDFFGHSVNSEIATISYPNA